MPSLASQHVCILRSMWRSSSHRVCACATAAAKAKPQLKGNIDGDLDDVRYAREALDDEYDFMVRTQLPAPPLRCSSKC